MKSLSIEDAFQWTQRFVAREWKLLLPVAFAFVAVPQLAFNLLMPAAVSGAVAKSDFRLIMQALQAAPWVTPAAMVVQLLGLAGALSIAALALVPRISVREAILLGLQRLFILVAAFFLFLLGGAIVLELLQTILGFFPLDPVAKVALLFLIPFCLAIYVWMRLIVLSAVVVATRAGPIAALRLAWELTAGAFWRILGCILIYSIGAQVVVLASTFALGAILVVTCNAIGAPGLGTPLSLAYQSMATAAFWAGFHILAVAIYRQLGGSIRGA